AHVHFRRRVARFGAEQFRDARGLAAAVRRHDARRQILQRFVAFAIVMLLVEREARLRDRLDLPRPGQPLRLAHASGSTRRGRPSGPIATNTNVAEVTLCASPIAVRRHASTKTRMDERPTPTTRA